MVWIRCIRGACRSATGGGAVAALRHLLLQRYAQFGGDEFAEVGERRAIVNVQPLRPVLCPYADEHGLTARAAVPCA
eukprot:7214876-Prymnesium_polylepis.1